ncbi:MULTISPECIES: N-acetylmuramoyl-L-alanine amidase [unclassified Microcoleus]|uniref:N-acetylmuramoyl-L-alanine amidase n=1 Tax=unclassified Microcoleus TaxID=2642155 RepID=UPI002FD24558
MKFHWLLPSFLSVFLLAGAAEAARLQSWRFDASENRLYITTEGGVQPKAQLIFNPMRLVIDLPGTSLGRPSVSRPLSGAIESVRVGQFDNNTTRIVVEIRDGFTIDPQQVRFRGISPSEWTVDLPTPVRGETQNPISEPGGERLSVEPSASQAQSGEATVVQNVQVTADGFLVRTAGGRPQINFEQSRAGDIATLDIEGASLAPGLSSQQPQTNGQHGVDKIEVRQLPTDPPVTRVTLRMKSPNTQWRASVSNLGGVVLLPGSVRQPSVPRSLTVAPPARQAQGNLARVQSIDLASNGTQLVVRTDRQVSYTSGWDQGSRAYWIRIASSVLTGEIPQLDANSPVSFSASQEDAETVVVWVQPRSGVEVGRVTRPNPQLLSLQLRSNASAQPLTRTPNLQPLPRRTFGTDELPQASNRRAVVVIDAGHGGRDPGAVGIQGIQEKEIVLDISLQVARLLEQQGVQAVMTRTDDREIDLDPRVSLAERVNASVFVSIHANAINMSRPDINGIETYYFNNGQDLARVIHASILEGTGASDRRVRQARFYVLRKTSMPSVLLEVGFVTGAEDAARLSDPAYRSQMAASIARGILLYLQQR